MLRPPARKTHCALSLGLLITSPSSLLGQLPESPQIAKYLTILETIFLGNSCPYAPGPTCIPAPVCIMKKVFTWLTAHKPLKLPQLWLNTQRVLCLQGTIDTVPALRTPVGATRINVGILVLILQSARTPTLFPRPWNPVYLNIDR